MKPTETTIRQQLRINKVKHDRRSRVPAIEKRFQALRRRPESQAATETVQRVKRELLNRLETAAQALQTISSQDLASLLSALALAEIALPEVQEPGPTADFPINTPYQGIPAESVTGYADDDPDENPHSSDEFLWRRQLEQLWLTHLTKDEFHRPVVRSLGVPVMCIVDHVRRGLSWDAICKLYPGLIHEEIRASVSMATECGWVTADDY